MPKIGLEGKVTATHPGEMLATFLEAIAREIGPYPHAKLSIKQAPEKKASSQIKLVCTDCKCTVLMSQKWYNEVGAPVCKCQMALVTHYLSPPLPMEPPEDKDDA